MTTTLIFQNGNEFRNTYDFSGTQTQEGAIIHLTEVLSELGDLADENGDDLCFGDMTPKQFATFIVTQEDKARAQGIEWEINL